MKITITIALDKGTEVAVPEGYDSLAEFLEWHTMTAVDELLENATATIASVAVNVEADA